MKRALKGFLQIVLGIGFIALLVYGWIWANTLPPDADIELPRHIASGVG
jgi:hypothetical protein